MPNFWGITQNETAQNGSVHPGGERPYTFAVCACIGRMSVITSTARLLTGLRGNTYRYVEPQPGGWSMSICWSLHLRREAASVPLARRLLLGTMETAGVDPDISHDLSVALT